MGNGLSYNQRTNNQSRQTLNQPSKAMQLSSTRIKNQSIQMQQLNRNLLAQYSYVDTIQEHENRQHGLRKGQVQANHRGQGWQALGKPQTGNGVSESGQMSNFIEPTITPQLYPHLLLQPPQCLDPEHTHNQNNANTHDRQASILNQSIQSFQEFRSSYITDSSQTTVYLEPPQFILRSPFLLNLLNRLLHEFFVFSQFLGWFAIRFYRLAIKFVFLQLVINAVLAMQGNIQCLTTYNQGIISLQKWLGLDCVLTTFILIFLGAQWFLKQNFKQRSTRRGPQFINKSIHIVQSSWILLYSLKFFILNSIGSAQFFTYTMNHPQNQMQLNPTTKLTYQMPKNQSFMFSQANSPITCPLPLNIYFITTMIYNYISIVFLCVFVIQKLV